VTCSKCGRRASERMSYTRRTEKTPFGPGVFIDEVFCDGELHDAADRVEETIREIRDCAIVANTIADGLSISPLVSKRYYMRRAQGAERASILSNALWAEVRRLEALDPPRAKETPDG